KRSGASEQRIEAALALEIVQVVAAADVRFAYKDLWKSPAPGAVDHFLALLGAAGGVDDGHGSALLFEERQGVIAERAEGADVTRDASHERLRSLVRSLYQCHELLSRVLLHALLQRPLCEMHARTPPRWRQWSTHRQPRSPFYRRNARSP